MCGKVIVGVFFFLFLFLFLSKWCLIRVRVKDGKGEAAREVSQWTLGAGGVHREYFHSWDGSEGGKRLIFFVKETLTHLARALGIL